MSRANPATTRFALKKLLSLQCSAASASKPPKVIVDPEAPALKKARTFFPKKPPYYGKCIEGAIQKANGKWSCPHTFPGREFDDLDAYRAAKKQRSARRAAYLDQIPEWQKK